MAHPSQIMCTSNVKRKQGTSPGRGRQLTWKSGTSLPNPNIHPWDRHCFAWIIFTFLMLMRQQNCVFKCKVPQKYKNPLYMYIENDVYPDIIVDINNLVWNGIRLMANDSVGLTSDSLTTSVLSSRYTYLQKTNLYQWGGNVTFSLTWKVCRRQHIRVIEAKIVIESHVKPA